LTGAFRIKSSYSLAYDPAAGEAMCYIAQCIISELALSVTPDELCEVNTDSVFVIGPEAAETARRKTAELTAKYKMDFEESHADAIYFSDVNNYVVYSIENGKYTPVRGKGNAYSDMNKKGSIVAVYKILFAVLPSPLGAIVEYPWQDYPWTDYIFKHHKSAASKYATIGGEPLQFKNYYFLWTTKDCPDAKHVSFSRDLINRQNGSIKQRFGVWSQSIKDLEKYKSFIDYRQYHLDLDDELELWNREDLCQTRLPRSERKTFKDILLLGVK
jgi:hypothetical protein